MTITALLGPTNTGKTHRALERLLEHPSGMIGVPLRLLAREVYDKLTTRVGESRVALITGEEKRVPAHPSYWVCTVEAMPLDLAVDFVAVDEIQLAAHDQRGHVFTERLLHARGTQETWFLGAETIRPIVERLVPTARVARLPRLSQLTSAGPSSLNQVPPRSAIVAFSAEKVFEIAERLRARKGGAAVVLGMLSPRARNAQVAMYQAGEVDYLVATDAIGMGLNLDVRHVAFGALRKFDGKDARDLEPAEVGQIAGRAGRHTRDGTFGTLSPLALPRDVVRAVERHRFDPITRVRWRSVDLDYGSIDALVRSLQVRPHDEVLRLDQSAEDLEALVALQRVDEVRARADSPAAVRLLWDVCRVPDYRKLLFESHVALLASLFVQLRDGRLDERWVEQRIAEADDPEGDIDTLTARLSAVRTWSYVANQSGWLARAAHFQARTRDVEDRLSDALHAKLVQRFVERTVRSVVVKKRDVVDPKHPFARLASLRAVEADLPDENAWVEELVDAPHARFSLDAQGNVAFGERRVGTLVRGIGLLTPDVRTLGLDDLAPGARSRVTRRIVAYARDVVEELFAPLRKIPGASGAVRGIVYQLEQTLGTVYTRDVRVLIDALAPEERAAFESIGVRFGVRGTWATWLAKTEALARRALLVHRFFDEARRPRVPRAGMVSFPLSPRLDERAVRALGFLSYGGRAIRADVVEAAMAAPRDRRGKLLGVPRRELAQVIEALDEDRP